jgi:hypothetical protein
MSRAGLIAMELATHEMLGTAATLTVSNGWSLVETRGEALPMTLARRSITDPSALGPDVDEEMRLMREFKVDGLIQCHLLAAAGPACTSSSRGSPSRTFVPE